MKRKAGFTLIELVVAIVMACILLATLTPLLTLAQNGTYTAQRSTRASQAGDAIYEYIASLLKNAERVYIGDAGAYQPADPDSWNKITVSRAGKDGVLTVNNTAVYPLEYQEDCALTLSVMGQSRNQLQLLVALADNRSSETLYTKTSAMTLSNLEGGGFGQAEGIVGGWVSGDGFDSTQTIGTAAGVGPLVIYFKGSGSLLPDFNPIPGGDHPQPTPGPSAFSVTLPARMEVEQGEQALLRGYVTWPAGVDEASKGKATWSVSAGGDLYLDVTNEETGSFPTAHLNGKTVTDPGSPVTVTLTVTCTVGGVPQSATAHCDITVWKNQNGNCFMEYNAVSGDWVNAADQTFFIPVNTGFQLRARLENGAAFRQDSITWKSSMPETVSITAHPDAQMSMNTKKVGYSRITFEALDTNGQLYHAETGIVAFDSSTFELVWRDAAETSKQTLSAIAGNDVVAQLIVHLPEGAPPDCLKSYNALLSTAASGNENAGWLYNWNYNRLFKTPSEVPVKAIAGADGTVRFNFPTLELDRAPTSPQEKFGDISARVYLAGYGSPKAPTVGEQWFSPRLSVTVSTGDPFTSSSGPIGDPVSVNAYDETNPFEIYAPLDVQSITNSANSGQWRWKIREKGETTWNILPPGEGVYDNFLGYSLSTDSIFSLRLWRQKAQANATYEVSLDYLPNNSSAWKSVSSIVTIAIK
ncbi:type II secretion system protein [Allofournierella sp.]|uniref:type II secretion system protein n=1 Tax=Allofournierella sp. TaxID=1940256 RepID=UPI003AB3EEC7